MSQDYLNVHESASMTSGNKYHVIVPVGKHGNKKNVWKIVFTGNAAGAIQTARKYVTSKKFKNWADINVVRHIPQGRKKVGYELRINQYRGKFEKGESDFVSPEFKARGAPNVKVIGYYKRPVIEYNVLHNKIVTG